MTAILPAPTIGAAPAKTTTTIEVTYADIQTGERHEPNRCPIALALQRADDTRRWFIGTTLARSVSIVGEYERSRFLPPEAREFVADFDRRLPVEPFTFEMQL